MNNQSYLKLMVFLCSLIVLTSCKDKNKPSVTKHISVTEKPKTETIIVEKEIKEEVFVVIDKRCVNAKSGLIFREIPEGKALGKFDYGEQVEIVELTGEEMTIMDEDKEVNGEWVGILTAIEGNDAIVYVFDGFLTHCFGGEISLSTIKAKNLPKLKEDEQDVLLFPDKTNRIVTYDNKFKPKGFLELDQISYAHQLEISEFEHPSKPNADYCDFAKFVKVSYQNQEYILFGDNVLNIEDVQELDYKTKQIQLIKAVDYSMGASDEEGLTFCGDDFSYLFIQDNNTISTIGHDEIMLYAHNDGIHEEAGKYEVVNDTIKTTVDQSFQEGTGKYDLFIFYDKGWDYEKSNVQRFYEG